MINLSLEAHPHRPDVELTGPVSREQLRQELAAADIVSCLRYPALEGASASVVEGLLSGKPVVVSATGCYTEIPDAVVFKVDPRHEHTTLTQAFETIVADYHAAAIRGQEAQRWATPRHCPERYASQLLNFAQQTLYNRPVLQLTDRIADQLRRWSAPADPLLLQQVDRVMFELFGSPSHHGKAA